MLLNSHFTSMFPAMWRQGKQLQTFKQTSNALAVQWSARLVSMNLWASVRSRSRLSAHSPPICSFPFRSGKKTYLNTYAEGELWQFGRHTCPLSCWCLTQHRRQRTVQLHMSPILPFKLTSRRQVINCVSGCSVLDVLRWDDAVLKLQTC